MRTILLLLLITFSEATIGVFVKLTGGLIPIHTVNFYAILTSALFLMILMPFATGNPLRVPWKNLKDTAIIGMLIATQISVFNYAMTLVPIANAVIFWSIAPFFTFIFSALFLDEKASWGHYLTFAVAIMGIVLAKPLEGGYMVGNLVALADGAIYAAMITYMRHEGKSETGNDIAWSMLVAALVLSPVLVIFGPGDIMAMTVNERIGIAAPAGLWALMLGLVSTGFAYFGISLVLKTLNANVYSLVDIIVSPVVAATLGFLVFGEVPATGMIYGGALLLTAGFVLTRLTTRDDPNLAAHPCQCT
ncbi:EamA family transporter [Nitratireductor aquimarinus]|uniref:EamA family transporter n=1 Tax=Nitratireductor aquimarinus TaxID=889300 RepID=UPI002935E9DA|nr:EamA family transporter [Nitratireductor aquimarinus]MDV2968072.1 EamA family transporter [Nitratireductor aquimarinus]